MRLERFFGFFSGTTVSACHLFKNLPVRRQFYSNKKKLREETKRVEDLVKQFAVIHPDVRFVLRADKSVVWQKSAVCSHYQALLHVWGSSVMAQLLHIQEKNQDLLVRKTIITPGEFYCWETSNHFFLAWKI